MGIVMGLNITPHREDTQWRRRYRRLVPSRTIGATFLLANLPMRHSIPITRAWQTGLLI
jgi:hypothetical protein